MNQLKKLSKTKVELEIKNLLSQPTQEKIKKAQKLAMSKNIKLGNQRKLFCKKCLTPFNSENSKIKIKKPYKLVKCNSCGFINRQKLV
jgi:RNase P subunit RPR2